MNIAALKLALDRYPDDWEVVDTDKKPLRLVSSFVGVQPQTVRLGFGAGVCPRCKRATEHGGLCDGCAVRALGGRLD
jgi:hypothetical protein